MHVHQVSSSHSIINMHTVKVDHVKVDSYASCKQLTHALLPFMMSIGNAMQALGECVSCMEAAPAVTLAPCSHRVLCRPCALIWVFRNRMTCPMCRGVVHSCSISKTELQNQR